ncbi:hypothetical protein A2363_04475 [Candidatus Gottesmanbacteria bacterium RIFOXYB1_FULL_47_11]|uniref:Type II secretion system protein GspG C-terminal domain-containing protein n=1 Tax=Candidatus Gottesmanbacteria bacterium RIFOXYB1_FULL_47_11 TaxID=1798401 RepID=A0A1F6BFC9_9BACT|nr:MAG: hypothetical protein A2363_04475 [Candidatus Gottesmanbacteria bacterium RIFOXYB1_FULL_47_11]
MNKKGFTLIELMIVMILLGVLATIGITSFISSQIKGRDATRKGDLRAIASALEMYYTDKGLYPVGSSGSITGCYTSAGATGICGKDYPIFKDSITSGAIWMAKFPVDPVSSQTYYYVSANGSQFQLYAHLENNQDPQCLQANCINPTVLLCGGSGVLCNYGVASANIQP